MNEENILKFDENNLFNNDILHQYDEDGQKGFLGYLLRNNKWKIVENKIVFPDIQTEEAIQELLKNYDTDEMKKALIFKKDTLDKVFVLGFIKTKEIIDNENKIIEDREKRTRELER